MGYYVSSAFQVLFIANMCTTISLSFLVANNICRVNWQLYMDLVLNYGNYVVASDPDIVIIMFRVNW